MRPLLACLSLALCAAACRREETAPEPSEPWQKPSVTTTEAPRAPLGFDVAADGQLRFRLPAREGTPAGSVPRLAGAFTVELDALERTRGTLSFDLGSLRLDDGGPADAASQGKNWLGLGVATDPAEQKRLAWGRFEMDSLEAPSLSRVSAEQARELSPGDRVITVRGAALGRLVIRNLAVSHRVRIDVDFHFSSPKAARPSRIVVRTLSAEAVPLVEHAIEPRDEAGRPKPSEAALLGRTVGKTALVEAEIALLPRAE